jgi:DNA-binding NarL/FixJ family response regulator
VTTVLLVDDHSVVIEGLTMLLASFDDLDVVATASTATGIVECYRSHRPDVVLMDLSMPVVDGVEATALLRTEFPDARVIVLTGSTDPHLVGAALDAGACGYLMKSASGDNIANAINSVMAGQSVFGPEAVQALRSGPEPVGPGGDLTPRETDVLRQVVAGRSNKQIANELGISPGTVRIHVSNILAKLGVSNRTAAALLAVDRRLV